MIAIDETTSDGGRALVGASDLGRKAPPHAWEAYFLIGIFPEKSVLSWCKVHLFSGGGRPGRYCLSAAEALDGGGERAVLLADAGNVARDVRPIGEGELARANDAWEVRAPGLAYCGAFPDLSLEIEEPSVHAEARARDVLWWVRVPRVLSYFGGFGGVRLKTRSGEARGLGIVEHAWGTDSRFDVARLSPERWQWDVLSMDGGAWCAGLAIGVFGALRGVRTGGRLAGGSFATGRSMTIRVEEWADEGDRRVPKRWKGVIVVDSGTLRYEARASTPLAPMVPGGGFLGTTFVGEWTPRNGPTRSVRGTGFTEYRAKGRA